MGTLNLTPFAAALLHPPRRLGLLAALVMLAATPGCWSESEAEVTVYTALDREFSEPILKDFEEAHEIVVLPKYDVESTKTVGLVNAIVQEQGRPRCDVFWNNEILHTLRLQQLGLLQPVQIPQADRFPPAYRSPTGHWYGFAARARILLVNTERVPEDQRPQSVRDLLDPRWQGEVGIAKPLFGTTATHAAVLFAHWGEAAAQEFFLAFRKNGRVMSGNKQVAEAVAQGELAFGLTDTDDAIVEIEEGWPVAIVYPDQAEDQPGTLLIPNTLCVIRGSENPEQARQLLEYLLTPEVERRLARGASAQFPLHQDVPDLPRVHQVGVRWMEVNFEQAAAVWDDAAEFLSDTFTSP